MTNGLQLSETFNQDRQSFLIKCDMVYYPMYLPLTYSPTYLPS
jgi:hypothetical protein